MVKQHFYREMEGGLPPLDESWWEAVLAEDEETHRSPSSKPSGSGDTPRNTLAPKGGEGLEQMDWDQALKLYDRDETVELDVSGYNRGGLLVNGAGLQGFVPISHLTEMPENCPDPETWLAEYVGRCLLLKVIECDRERGRVVFSERAALAEPGSRNMLLKNLNPGDCVSGVVTNITDFGVFVDLGGVEGLIHVSEISWGRVRHPSDVVNLGQELRVYVINVDQERARVALSLKRLFPNPWETAEARYFPGQVMEAVVTSIVPFGVFARLEEGLDGLIHISEISLDGEKNTPEKILREGQKVKVRVLHVDGSRQRLGLSLRISEEA